MVKSIKQFFSFPLLWKELNEQANRKRTYVLRVLYCLALMGIALFLLSVTVQNRNLYNSDYEPYMMGEGKDLLVKLYLCNLIALFLVLPASMAGVITREKERRSFELLLLTGLSPTKILLEKYISRILPMFYFVISIILPLSAVCYM